MGRGMDQRWLLVVCDAPGCENELRVPIRAGYWLGQPWQEAMNYGWDVSRHRDLCPMHIEWFPVQSD